MEYHIFRANQGSKESNIDYRLRRRNYLRFLKGKIHDYKLKIEKMERQYEAIKRHSTITKEK